MPTYVQKASVGPGNQAAIAFCAAINSLQKKDDLTLFPLGKDTFYHRDNIWSRDRA